MKTIGTLLFASLIGVVTNNTPYTTNIEIEYNRHSVKHDTMPLLIKTVDKLDSLKVLEGKRIVISDKKSSIPKVHLDYLKKHVHLAIEVEKKYGIPAEICLVQAIFEGGAGTSWLARNANNHFGIKAMKGKPWVQPKKAKWTKFASVEESYDAYGRVLKRLLDKLYPNGWSVITPLDVVKTPYAGTNNWDYAVKCDKIIRNYKLKEFVKNNNLNSL
jgi:flagellum-specific peptidoglycan hydrolase FlgJ